MENGRVLGVVGRKSPSLLHDDLPARKIEELKRAGCERIYSDKASGARTVRPGLQQALDYMRESDVLVVWRLGRLGRSLIHLIDTISLLEKRGTGYPYETETGTDLPALESRIHFVKA